MKNGVCVLRASAAGRALHCADVQVLNRRYGADYLVGSGYIERRSTSHHLREAQSALLQLSRGPVVVVAARSLGCFSAFGTTTDANGAGSVFEHVVQLALLAFDRFGRCCDDGVGVWVWTVVLVLDCTSSSDVAVCKRILADWSGILILVRVHGECTLEKNCCGTAG
jgi:hypothetical protein